MCCVDPRLPVAAQPRASQISRPAPIAELEPTLDGRTVGRLDGRVGPEFTERKVHSIPFQTSDFITLINTPLELSITLSSWGVMGNSKPAFTLVLKEME